MPLRQPAKRARRERWQNHLNPAINHLKWSSEDELLLESCAKVYRARWSCVLKHTPRCTLSSPPSLSSLNYPSNLFISSR